LQREREREREREMHIVPVMRATYYRVQNVMSAIADDI